LVRTRQDINHATDNPSERPLQSGAVLLANEIVKNGTSECGFDTAAVEPVTGIGNGPSQFHRRYSMKSRAPEFVLRQRDAVLSQYFEHMPGDRFTFYIIVCREEDAIHVALTVGDKVPHVLNEGDGLRLLSKPGWRRGTEQRLWRKSLRQRAKMSNSGVRDVHPA
jgi:hypothetical protein